VESVVVVVIRVTIEANELRECVKVEEVMPGHNCRLTAAEPHRRDRLQKHH